MRRVQPFEQAKHGFGRTVVKVPGWFVGQQQAWLGHQCPCQRNALLFPTGKLAGKVVRSVFQSDFAQQFPRFGESGRLGLLTCQQGHGHIFQGRKFRQ